MTPQWKQILLGLLSVLTGSDAAARAICVQLNRPTSPILVKINFEDFSTLVKSLGNFLDQVNARVMACPSDLPEGAGARVCQGLIEVTAFVEKGPSANVGGSYLRFLSQLNEFCSGIVKPSSQLVKSGDLNTLPLALLLLAAVCMGGYAISAGCGRNSLKKGLNQSTKILLESLGILLLAFVTIALVKSALGIQNDAVYIAAALPSVAYLWWRNSDEANSNKAKKVENVNCDDLEDCVGQTL